jgi:hypothetical protein
MTKPRMLSLLAGLMLLTFTAAYHTHTPPPSSVSSDVVIYQMIPTDETQYEDWVPENAVLFRNPNINSVRVRNAEKK